MAIPKRNHHHAALELARNTASRWAVGVAAAFASTLALADATAAGNDSPPFIVPPVMVSGSSIPSPPEGRNIERVEVSGDARYEKGRLQSSGDAPREISLAVTLADTADGSMTTRRYTTTLLPADSSHELLAFDRTPTSASEANNADIALSMHLALDGEPLFHNYGIFFPKVSETPPPLGTHDEILHSLRDPHLAYLANGNFGIMATRTARGGGSDGSQASSVLLAVSDDLLDYRELGLLDLGVTDGVNDPAFAYHSALDRYVITWRNDAGTDYHASFDTFSPEAEVSPPQRGKVTMPGRVANSDIADFQSGSRTPITREVAEQLTARFEPIRNLGARLPSPLHVELDTAFDANALPARILLDYSDGSTNSLAVEWDDADINNITTQTPGRYRVHGTLKQEIFPTPLADERADPMIVPFAFEGNDYFLMVATKDLNLDPINNDGEPTGMPLRMAPSIRELADTHGGDDLEVDILSAGTLDASGNPMTGCFWAPEMHHIDNRLSILFMPCYDGEDGQPDMWTGRASIVQLKQNDQGEPLDPRNPANWTTAEQVVRADGSLLNPLQGISLDMTFFVDEGQAYYAWQMLGAVYIATMDPDDPTRLTSEPTRIIAPHYAWENTIAEGPNVFIRDGTVNMLYSGSLVGDTYATGLARATSGDNLTDPASWERLNYPVHKSEPYNGEFLLGTGHGAWSYDADGNQIYVFHVRTDHQDLGGRDTFVQRVHWTQQGLPRFNIETEHELAPQFREIAIDVVVGDPQESKTPGSTTSSQ